ENQEASDFAVVNADDPSVLELASRARARTLYFARDAAVVNGTTVENGWIVRRGDPQALGDVGAGGARAHSASSHLHEPHARAPSRAVDEPAAHGVSRGSGGPSVSGDSRSSSDPRVRGALRSSAGSRTGESRVVVDSRGGDTPSGRGLVPLSAIHLLGP